MGSRELFFPPCKFKRSRKVEVKAEITAETSSFVTEKTISDADIMIQSPGLGAILDNYGGCVFRVWAPHADSAQVVLYEKDSPGPKCELIREGGVWALRVPGIRAGCKYHFVFQHKGEEHERRDARGRETVYDSNACVVVDPHYCWCPFQAPTWDKLNIYQLHVGAYTGREEGGGKFKSLEARLDYIRDLGFTAIELLPVHEYCGSWGYNPRLLFAVHQMYGQPQHLRELVDTAHQKGLSVLFDLVLNHGAARLNSLWAYDGWNENNRGGLYFDGGRDTPFGKGFAWWQKEIQDMIFEASQMFLSEYNGDGLRLDCVHEIPWKVLQTTTRNLRDKFPGKILISEMTPETPKVISDAGFDATWMHSSFYDMRAFMNERRSLRKLESLFSLHPGYTSPTQCIKYFLGCHDQTGCRKNGKYDPEIQGLHRYAVDLFGGRGTWEGRAKARFWYGGQLAAVGIPMLFMGTEFHHSGWWGVERENMINWDLSRDRTGQEMLSLVKEGNFLRQKSPSLRYGNFSVVHFDEKNCVLGFLRKVEGETMLVVVNGGESQWEKNDYGVQTGVEGGNLVEKLNTQEAVFGGWEGSGNCGKKLQISHGKLFINLPKWSVLIFEFV